MVFPTLAFLIFYCLVWPLSWGLVALRRHGAHKLSIIAASYIFYAFWSWRFAFLLLSSVLLNWSVGRAIGSSTSPRLRRAHLAFGVLMNLAVLGFFKYYGWFAEEMGVLLRLAGLSRDIPLFEVVLPVGISFFTFQGISYIVDLYRGDLDRARPLVDVMFFISFFPHLVAGPIVRAASFLPQLERPPRPDRVFVGLGMMLIVWGVWKKAVVANWLAVLLVDKAFFDPAAYGALDLAAAIYGYAVQIYCDFSAYSDIAIGVAALLGYRFQRNFNQPYRAVTLADFWRRWHMSLSSWLRDYLYVPLGGNKGGKVRTLRNLLLTMLLGGIWHGAAWKFVAWGFLHGGALAIERLLGFRPREPHEPAPPAWKRVLPILIVFHFVCFAWIFFRADDMAKALAVLAGLADWQRAPTLLTPLPLALIAFGLAIQFTPANTIERLDRIYQRLPTIVVGALVGAALLLIEAVGGDGSAPFIYFQF
ncbi:MAG TPA: MBOAT family O-acyltransferase [Hyphomicrobiaceae bacterium]|nr:MBOAT family O-acyltransferase [Hyphomicrobiaceae bacterium]